MRTNKKMIGTILLAVVIVFTLVGCGEKDKETSNDSSQENTDAKEAQGYVFEVNGVTIGVDMDMDAIAKKLGEPNSVFEEPSCAAQGTAYLYTYPGFQVNTYPDGDKNLVGTIILKDDTFATQEGIDLSMTKEDIIKTYGDQYEGDEKKISYEKDGMKLSFILDGESIASIEYNSSIME